MKKALLLTTFLLGLSAPAFCTQHYFDNGSPDNTLPCTIGDPCDNFAGTTLDNASQLACGDTLNFKRGEIWLASEAEVEVNTLGCDGNPIIVQSYGTGANPIFAGADITTVGWSVFSGSIYQLASQSQTHLHIVTEDDNKGLMLYNGTSTTLPAGSWKRSGSTLYVRLWDSADPATNNVRIGSYAHTSSADGSRGLVRSTDTSARSNYHYFRDLTILASNGIGFSYGGTGGRDAGLVTIGTGYDSWYCYHRTGGGQCGEVTSYYGDFSYGSSQGSGFGQGMTTFGGPFVFIVGAHTHHHGMSGLDFLDFASDTNVTESGTLRVYTHENSLSPNSISYDANLYMDGASETWHHGLWAFGGGGFTNNARQSVSFGSEHPTTKPSENHWLINYRIWGTHWVAFGTDNECYNSVSECPPSGDATPALTNKNIVVASGTMAAYDAGGFEMVYNFGDINTTADNVKMFNNIYISDSAYVNAYIGTLPWTWYKSNYNLFYKRGSAPSTTDIFASGGGGTPRYNLAGWVTAQTEDANSVYGDPTFVSDLDTSSADHHVGGASPAINAGADGLWTQPSWLPAEMLADVGSNGVRGSVLASGVEDSGSRDIGYHYDYAWLTNVSVVPTSLVQNAVTSATATWTCPKRVTTILYDSKVKVTFPAGFVLNSGGTSSVSSSNISGTWSACTVDGQSITCPRAGDGNSEFPELLTSTNIVISNVQNPNTTGLTGTFTVDLINTNNLALNARYGAGLKYAEAANNSVAGVTISGSGGAAPHVSCSGVTLKGVTLT